MAKTFDGPLGALVRFTSDGIMVVNRVGRTLFANQTAAHCLGFASVDALKRVPVADLIGRFVVETGEGEGAGDTTTVDLDTWFSQSDQLFRFRDPTAGWDRWVQVRSSPFVEQAGSPTAFLIVLRDLTNDRRRESGVGFLAEAARRLTQSLVRQRILEHASVVAVPRLGDECVIIERNDARVWSPESFYLPGGGAAERASALLRNVAPLLVQVETSAHPLLVGPTREARGMPLSGSMILVPMKQGKLVSGAILLGMARDTARCHHPSDLALAEQFADRLATALGNAQLFDSEQRRRLVNDDRLARARRATDRRDALLVSAAYALSNQLSPLLSIADLLEAGGEAGGDPQRLGEVLRRQSQRLRSVIEALLKASRSPGEGAEAEDQMRKIRESFAASPPGVRPT